jgi:DnaJ like chaperone protein
MGLLGTLIGGSIGMFFGGPLGAIIGGAIGSNVKVGDMQERAGHPGQRQSWGSVGPRPASYQEAQQAFMVALISLAAKVAKADGSVSRAEIQSFDDFLKVNMGMSVEDRKVAAKIFNEARDSTVPAEDFARQIKGLLGHQPDRMRDLISLLMKIALADGHMHPEEDVLIRSIARELGLSARDFESAGAMFESPVVNLDAAYAVLGVESTVRNYDVKQAYRRLAKEYHPDVLARQGMGEDFKQFAEEKMASINEAYDQIKEARGM